MPDLADCTDKKRHRSGVFTSLHDVYLKEERMYVYWDEYLQRSVPVPDGIYRCLDIVSLFIEKKSL